MKTKLTDAEKMAALVALTNAQIALAALQSEIIHDFVEGEISFRPDLVAYTAFSHSQQVIRQVSAVAQLLEINP